MGSSLCFTSSSFSNGMGRKYIYIYICKFGAGSSSSIGWKIVGINDILMLDYIKETAYISLIM